MAHKHNALLGLVLLVHSASAQSPNITAYEYWFDQDHTTREHVEVTPTGTVDLTDAPLNTMGLSHGQHVAHFRLKDQQGSAIRWSSVVSRALHIGQPGPGEITALRYWWSNLANPPLGTDMRYLYFDTPQSVLAYDGLLELCGYPAGQQVLKLQLRDNHGQWSSVVTRPVNIIATPNMAITSINPSMPQLCTGDTVTFTAQPVIAPDHALPTSYVWSFPTDWVVQPSDSGSIEVIVGDSLGEITVTGSNYCEQTAAASLMVTNVNCTVGVTNPTDRPGVPTVFPNPSTGTFRISMEEGSGPPELTVLDLLGRQVLPRIVPTADGQLEIDLQDEASGTYLLRMRVQDEWMVVPIVIIR